MRSGLGSGSRWWCRNIQNSPPVMDTLHLQDGSLSSEKNLKTSRAAPLHKANERETMSKWVGEVGTPPRHKPHCWPNSPPSGENAKSQASVWGREGLYSTLGTPFLKTATWEMSPQHICLGRPTGSCPWPLGLWRTEGQLLKGLHAASPAPGPRQGLAHVIMEAEKSWDL